jgi:hypothetical protein
LFVVFGLICSFFRILCLHTGAIAIERTSTGSTHSKGSSSADFCQKFIFGLFCEFLNFSFIFF